VCSDTIYVSGVYNGRNTTGPSHRAIIPATNAITITNSKANCSALDIERATYYRRTTSAGFTPALIEQRWYAHRVRHSLLVHEIFVDNSKNTATLQLSLKSLTRQSPDFNITTTDKQPLYIQYGADITTTEEPNSKVVSISVVSTIVPQTLMVGPGQKQTYYYFTSIR